MSRLLLLASSPVPPERAAAARAAAIAAIKPLQNGDVLLLRKDAFSVESSVQGFRRVAFMLDGVRLENGVPAASVWYDREKISPGEHVSWPLHRDRKLVEAAAKAQKAGWEVETIVVRDAQSDVATDHLVRTCKEMGVRGKAVMVAAAEKVPGPTESSAADPTWTDRDMVFTDLETTGLSPKDHHVIQIGSVHCDPYGRVVRREFEIKLHMPPGFVPDPYAIEINGYTPERWLNALLPDEGMKRWLAWLPPKFIHANQFATFDRNHLTAMLDRYQLASPGWWPKKVDVCTKKMAHRYLFKTGKIPNAKLETICSHYGIPNENAHDALVDARRSRLAFVAMSNDTSLQQGAPSDGSDADECE